MIGKPLYRSLFSNKVAGLQSPNLPKKVPAQVLFCQFCEIFLEQLFKRTLETASNIRQSLVML